MLEEMTVQQDKEEIFPGDPNTMQENFLSSGTPKIFQISYRAVENPRQLVRSLQNAGPLGHFPNINQRAKVGAD